jgi:hypothetical protein
MLSAFALIFDVSLPVLALTLNVLLAVHCCAGAGARFALL